MPDNCGKEHVYIVYTQDSEGNRYQTQTRAYSKAEASKQVLDQATNHGAIRTLIEVKFLWY